MRIIFEIQPEEGGLRLDFPVELPILQPWSAHWWIEGVVADRSTLPVRWANRQAKNNRGRFAQEIPFAAHVYAVFLSQLVTIPGLEALVASSRYSLTLRIGRCFEAREIAQCVVELVLRSFYPEWSEEMVELVPHEKLNESMTQESETPLDTVPHFMI